MVAPALELLAGNAAAQMVFLTAVGDIHPTGRRLCLAVSSSCICHTEINWRKRLPFVSVAGRQLKLRLSVQPHYARC